MSEEIDIIELLKRVKEGKAPKKIMIGETEYEYMHDWDELDEIYQDDNWRWLNDETVNLDTKIKILDKPIIEELEIPKDDYADPNEVAKKINEIIRHINKEEK